MTGTPRRPRLSSELERLLREVQDGRKLTLGEIEERLRGRGFALLIMMLAVPFLLPNIPGLSTPFGIAIMLMGFRIMIGRKPWLPGFILRKELSTGMMEKILRGLYAVVSRMERLVRPRMPFLQSWPGMANLIGLGITLGGIFLLLPLPFPFTNTFPALSILLLTAGMMERDGLCVLAGHIVGILAWGYLAGWLLLGRQGMQWLSI